MSENIGKKTCYGEF